MKKQLVKTKCTVKLRKSEYHDEWYLILESYPVFKSETGKPQRIIETLNRMLGYRGVMAVGAVDDQGIKSSYSERGANLWVSAPGGEFCDTHTITTTDRTGALGDNPLLGYVDYANLNYTRCMNGTSASTPMVAGVAALMLQANPNLSWRDVRVILAKTARKNDSSNTEWKINGSGINYNPNYGFGVVDAYAAVTTAKTYTAYLPTAEKTSAPPVSSPNLAIPDAVVSGVTNTLFVTDTIPVTGSGITRIEFIEITFSATDHTYSGDLEITLTSPAGGTLLSSTGATPRPSS